MAQATSSPDLPWHELPPSLTGATCKVYLYQAGSLDLPEDLVLLPGPNEPNESTKPKDQRDSSKRMVHLPDYVFFIEHTATGDYYQFDLGMRTDMENLPPFVKDNVLPGKPCYPVAAGKLLKELGSEEQQPEKVKAVFFSHLHFDHIGDGAKEGFTNAELWVGPTACTYARPGHPIDENGAVLSENLPMNGSRKIVEPSISDGILKNAGDKRVGLVAKSKNEGKYEAVELRETTWIGLGAFDRGFDVFGDGSAYLLDSPGHSAGHQMMLIRVKAHKSASGEEDDFVLLAGDCFHHPAILKDPKRTARPPYSKHCMHTDPEVAVDTIYRTRALAERSNVWVVGAHDHSVGDGIGPGKQEIEGLVLLNDWKMKAWKKPLSARL
ncbi:hypothetical protein BDV96DRAFT_482477 [Lophiotrema nucula]|uniref:Metallo-beta-lactamase domain-containing protein n=1 Tax=Lophiotrema nucula TaxID=690887 RepID=A0A6A5ZPY5_9PLEO|nr:hypothetical protein BDV96DRAFT_482477 [Lophiotrema nucula]